MRGVKITTEKVRHNGHLICSAIVGDQYMKQQYIGYTKKEAEAEFRDYLREELAKNITAK